MTRLFQRREKSDDRTLQRARTRKLAHRFQLNKTARIQCFPNGGFQFLASRRMMESASQTSGEQW
jgi:hypothetical protein